ncbi:hypothetical protein GQ53DRAFT_819683 [Thozetella sp. PMI_491]|nr:hypothetical protein GQ53DRAFT_819683 [Thozetella sp. PMI_491]
MNGDAGKYGKQANAPAPETSAESSPAEVAAKAKRPRLQYSCTHCREKKLKCNRAVPCDQCEKRKIEDSCNYIFKNASPAVKVPAVHRARQIVAENAALKKRVAELAELVTPSGLRRSGSAQRPPSTHLYSPAAALGNQGDDEADVATWSGSHDATTAGVLIVAATAELSTQDNEVEAGSPGTTTEAEGPLVLLRGPPDLTVRELLKALPPRSIADKLITEFFQLEEPGWMAIHLPTFLEQYDNFWAAPEDVSFTWLALLYTIFSYASWYCIKSGEPSVFEELSAAVAAGNAFRAAAAQCFVRGNYTIPGKHKVEALVIYFGMEYFRNAQQATAPLSAPFLWAGIVRLALHMGYHRDPRHFKDITPFEGEMRRRVWAQILECDTVVSFIFGLPPSVPGRFVDTELPRNLHDEDLREDLTELPPPRPDSEKTRVSYTITSCRLHSVLADILSAMMDHAGASYTKVLELDAKLRAAERAIPTWLHPKSLTQSMMDPAGVIVQRYLLLILDDKWYARSHWACIDAAIILLQNQFEMDNESKPGGRLAKVRWVVMRNIPDYLLAGMILCLELSYLSKASDEPRPDVVVPTEQILNMLRMSRQIWAASHKESADASRAFEIISRMLSISTGEKYRSSLASSDSGEDGEDRLLTRPQYAPPRPTGKQARTSSGIPGCNLTFSTAELVVDRTMFGPAYNTTPSLSSHFPFPSPSVPTASSLQMDAWASHPGHSSFPGFDVEQADVMLNVDPIADWALFDAQIQNVQGEETQIPWGSFFSTAYQ